MASQGDLKRLRDRLRELEKTESKYKRQQEDFDEQKKALDHWRTAHQSATAEKEQLARQLDELTGKLSTKEDQLKEAQSQITSLQRAAERAKKNAKFENIAREGQAKKLGVLEHSVKTLRHDLASSLECRTKLEDKSAKLERQWQNERGLRLQDLHRHEAMASETHQAGEAVATAEEKWLAAEKRMETLNNMLGLKNRELQAQRRINTAQAGETSAQNKEIDLLRTELMACKRVLLTKQGQISMGVSVQKDLQRELSRVRRDYITSTNSRNEQHRAMLGGMRVGSKQSSSPWQVELKRKSIDQGPVPVKYGGVQGGEVQGQRLGTCASQGSLKLTAVAAESFRKGISLDDAFLTKVEAPPHRAVSGSILPQGHGLPSSPENYPGFLGQGGVETGHPASMVKGCSLGPPSCGSSSPETMTTDRPNAQKRRVGAPRETTLRVAGSLYVGAGLGVKKHVPWESGGLSAKRALQKILEKHLAHQLVKSGEGSVDSDR